MRPLLAALALTLAASPAGAAHQCMASRQAMAEALGAGYGEPSAGFGLAGQDLVVELFVAPDGATWTAVVVQPGGITCVLASGAAWMWRRPPVPLEAM
jgi:hypothetical protein